MDHFWWMGFELSPSQVVNNWNVWCNSNVLQAFALMETDKDKLAKAVYKPCALLTGSSIIIRKTEPEEGPSYCTQQESFMITCKYYTI